MKVCLFFISLLLCLLYFLLLPSPFNGMCSLFETQRGFHSRARDVLRALIRLLRPPLRTFAAKEMIASRCITSHHGCRKRIKSERRHMSERAHSVLAARFDIVDHAVRLMSQHIGTEQTPESVVLPDPRIFISDSLFAAAAEALVELSVSLQGPSGDTVCAAICRKHVMTHVVHLTHVVRLLRGWMVRRHTLQLPRAFPSLGQFAPERNATRHSRSDSQRSVAVDSGCRRLFALLKRLVRVYEQACIAFPRRCGGKGASREVLAEAAPGPRAGCRIFAILSSFRVATVDFVAAVAGIRPRGLLSTHCSRCCCDLGNGVRMKTTTVISGALRCWPNDAFAALLRIGPPFLQRVTRGLSHTHVCLAEILRMFLPVFLRAANTICSRVVSRLGPHRWTPNRGIPVCPFLSRTFAHVAAGKDGCVGAIGCSSVGGLAHWGLSPLIVYATGIISVMGARVVVRQCGQPRADVRLILGHSDSDSRLGSLILSAAAKLLVPEASAHFAQRKNNAHLTRSVYSQPWTLCRMLPCVRWPKQTLRAIKYALGLSVCRSSAALWSSCAPHPDVFVAGICCLKLLAALRTHRHLQARAHKRECDGPSGAMGAMPTALGAALCLLRGRGRNSYAPLLVAVADIVDAAKITAGEIVAAASDAAVPSRELPCQLCAPNIRPIATLLLHNVSNAHRAVRIHTLRILAGFSSFYLGKFTGSPLGNAGRDMSPALDICLVAERMPITMASERSRNVLLRRLESLAASERLPWAHTYAVAQYAASLFYVRYSRMWPGALRILTSLSKSRGPGGGKLFRAALPYILNCEITGSDDCGGLWQHYWILWPVLWNQALKCGSFANTLGRSRRQAPCDDIVQHSYCSAVPDRTHARITTYSRTNMPTYFALVWHCLASGQVSSLVEARNSETMPRLVLCLRAQCRVGLLGRCAVCRSLRKGLEFVPDGLRPIATNQVKTSTRAARPIALPSILFLLAKFNSAAWTIGHGTLTAYVMLQRFVFEEIY